MLPKIKKALRLRLTTSDHNALGHKLVAHWGQEEISYSFNWKKHRIIEVCKGDLTGHCWIEEI